MRLTKEHIGKKVYRPWFSNTQRPFTLIALNGTYAWLKDRCEIHCTYDNNDGWEFEEEKKKPSEIIRKRASEIDGNTGTILGPFGRALLEYLDEVEEKK